MDNSILHKDIRTPSTVQKTETQETAGKMNQPS